MSIFENSFFSIEGQKERIKNVGQTIISAISGKGVQSNTGNKTADTVLSAAASNPFTTAAVVAVAAAPTAALGTVKAGFSALPTGGKVAAVVAAPVVTSAVIANPNIAKSAAQAPAKLSQFGSNIGTLSKNPTLENATQVFKDNPILTSAAVVGTGVIVGKGASSLIATAANTSAIRKNTEVMTSGNVGISGANEYDVKLLEKQAKAQKEMAELELSSQKSAQEYNLKMAELQSKSATAAAISSPNVIAEPSQIKKTPKKRAKSKKKVAKKKKTSTKKATKKKKKSTKKATKR